jgi:hypothetical protein
MPSSSLPSEIDVRTRFVEACSEAGSILEIQEAAWAMRGHPAPLDYNVGEFSPPDTTADVLLPDQSSQSWRRVLVQGYSASEAAGEAGLAAAGIGYFPAYASTSRFSFREMPLATIPLLSHNLNSRTGNIVARNLLAPALRQLFVQRGEILTAPTMNRLVHIESIEPTKDGDQLHTGLRILPPYEVEAVSPEAFVTIAIRNAQRYGERIQQELSQTLGASPSV